MRTVILFDGPLNEAAQAWLSPGHLLAQAQALSGHSLQYRLPAGQLDLVAGRPFLCLPDPRGFLRLLDKRGGTLTAYATAPPRTLRRLHGASFVVADHQRVVLRCPVGDAWAYEPRLVQFAARDIAPVTRLSGREEISDVSATPHPGSAAVLFDPWVVPAAQLADPLTLPTWCQEVGGRGARSRGAGRFSRAANVVVLPPVGLEEYRVGPFAPELVALRRQLCAGELSRRRRPAFLSLVSCHDHPLLRDLLAEGARLGWDGQREMATRATLTLVPPRRDLPQAAIARYRWSFWTGHDSSSVAWRNDVRRAWRYDVTSLAGCRVRCDRHPQTDVWNPLPEQEVPCPSASPSGAFQQLSALSERLDDLDLRRSFFELILGPARPVNGGHPDHDLAERRFLQRVARMSWTSHEAFEQWRTAVSVWLSGQGDSRASRPCSVGPGFRRASRRSRPAVLFYPPHVTESEIAVARLLAPLGTRLIPDHEPRLDRATLDRGFRLS